MKKNRSIFEKKSELLCKGLFLDQTLISHYKKQGIEIDFGRKGGAGPLGGRYFLFEDNTLVNAALWDDLSKTNLYLGKKVGTLFEVIDKVNNGEYCKLKLVENPQYYDIQYKTTDGIPMKKIALVHGVDCLASTIYQKCIYWACGEACAFCGIELSLQNNATIEEKNAQQICEVINMAKRENRCSHMTLTSGTDEMDDKGARRYIELLKGIRKVYPDLPLHVQIEPLENGAHLRELKEAGADTIGIHIEILDESLRQKFTPGKATISRELFDDNWHKAVDIFGRDQVETFILTGFGETIDILLNEIEKVTSLGVIPFITPVRSIPGKKDLPQTEPETLIQIYITAAKMMKKYGINPLKNKAGCVRCGGCSAINEAYKVV
jgi:radical SAM protein (TIGR04043 family)